LQEDIVVNGVSILNQDIGNSTTSASQEPEVAAPQADNTDSVRRAIEILSRGPNTLEEVNEIRTIVFTSPESWEKIDKFIRETISPDESEYSLIHAIGLAILGHYEVAEPELLELDTTPVVGCLLARIYQETDREQEAVTLLRKIHDRVPEVNEYHILLCRALEAAADLDGFRKELEIIEGRHPDDADTFALKGLSMEHDGEYEAAKRLYAETLEKKPDHQMALFRLGFRADLENRDDEAIEYYTRARNGGVPNVASLINLGLLFEDSEEYEEAVQCYETVLNFHPANVKATSYLRDAEASLSMYYDEEKERKEDKQSQILKIPVSDFELSVRSRNCLAKMDIQTLGDLIKRTEAELLAFKNFGETSLMEIKEILSSKGLRLGMISSDSTEIPELPDPEDTNTFDEVLLQKTIEELDFSIRSKSCLHALDIKTLGQLAATSEQMLMNQKNFGQTSLNEIRKRLADFGLSLNV
jgi:DNA-directed RNA polymerase subunit alpha